MSYPDRNPHWALMARRLPGGLTVIGPDLLEIIGCALQDGRAHRAGAAQEYCPACTARHPGRKCVIHQLDDDTAYMYAFAQRLLGQLTPREQALPGLLDALRITEQEGGR
jgi:hypothetical protein